MLQHNGTDPIDRKILQELSADARLSVAELGRRITLSPLLRQSVFAVWRALT